MQQRMITWGPERRYRRQFSDERYRSATADFGPFGNEAGADVWHTWRRRGRELVGDRATVRHVLAVTWGLDEQELDLADFGNADAESSDQLGALIGAGFALVRLTGGIDPDGLQHVLAAIERAWEITGEAWFPTMHRDLATAFGVVSTLPEPTPVPTLVEDGYLTDDRVLSDRPVAGDPESWFRREFGEAFVSVDPGGPGPFQTEAGAEMWRHWADRADELPADASVRHLVAAISGADPDAMDLTWLVNGEDAQDGLIAASFTLLRLRASIDVESFELVKYLLDPEATNRTVARRRWIGGLHRAVLDVYGKAWAAHEAQLEQELRDNTPSPEVPWLRVGVTRVLDGVDDPGNEVAETPLDTAEFAWMELQDQLQTHGDIGYRRLRVTPWSVWAADTFGPDTALTMKIYLWVPGQDIDNHTDEEPGHESDFIIRRHLDPDGDAYQALGQLQTWVTDALRAHLTRRGITSELPAWPTDTPRLDALVELHGLAKQPGYFVQLDPQ